MARVYLAPSAGAALDQMDFVLAEAVIDALGILEHDPTVGYQLRGRLSGLRSYRLGAYRIIYQLRGAETVRVAAIRHRSEAYGTDPP